MRPLVPGMPRTAVDSGAREGWHSGLHGRRFGRGDEMNSNSVRRRRSIVTTVLFTDIVGSSEQAAGLGDAGWRELLDRHNEIVRGELKRAGGREIDTAGDGFL